VIVTVAGGVGAARFLRGLIRVVPPSDVTAVVNTADDIRIHGLHVSPDLDTVTYTLAGAINPETGWGLAGETWSAMDALGRYGPVRPPGSDAGTTWFNLGDRDLATHLYRTQRLAEGADLATVTAEIARAWGLSLNVVPMSGQRVETRLTVEGPDGPEEIGFQEYFVHRRHSVVVRKVRFDGIDDARPAPGVLGAIQGAEHVVIAPSNPIVSIGPVLAVPGLRDALVARRDRVVAVSPIVAGAALKGPADRLLTELGHEASVVGVARLYRDVASTLVVDEADAGLASRVEGEGMRCVVTPTVMHGPDEAAALARTVLGLEPARPV
jgi:LPPG:FO 2-phospho-L-lactate transferase